MLSVAQVVSNHKAWNQLIFLGGFLTFVNSLKVLHVISWFERALEQLLVHVEGKVLICVVLALLYFVSMYAFCSKSRRPAFVALNA